MIDKEIPLGILEVLRHIAKKSNRDVNEIIQEYKKGLEEGKEQSKRFFLVRALKDMPYTKIKKGDLLKFSVKYQLKDKQIYCFRYNENNYLGIYHEKTKKFFIDDETIPPRMEDVNIIGEFKSKFINPSSKWGKEGKVWQLEY